MKSLRIAKSIIVVLAASAAFAQSSSQTAFAKLKSLEGSWAGKNTEGKPVQTTYHATSGGSAIMSEIHGEENMVSMFHMDGDRLMMTHYCGSGNQPRMVGTASPDGKSVSFNYLDATNLLPSQPGHMEHLVVALIDANHYTEQWDFASKDGPKMHELFEMQRTK